MAGALPRIFWNNPGHSLNNVSLTLTKACYKPSNIEMRVMRGCLSRGGVS